MQLVNTIFLGDRLAAPQPPRLAPERRSLGTTTARKSSRGWSATKPSRRRGRIAWGSGSGTAATRTSGGTWAKSARPPACRMIAAVSFTESGKLTPHMPQPRGSTPSGCLTTHRRPRRGRI